MLRELSIRNFALIEQIHLTFDDGFHVLTGETGAGKSIFVDALLLIAGGRSSSEFVRHGALKAEIEALFELDGRNWISKRLSEWGVTFEENSLLIRRDVYATGRSSCRINGQLVTLSMIKEIGSGLLDISGQHEHQMLLKKDEHLDWLDHFGGEPLLRIRGAYQVVFEETEQIQKELKTLTQTQRETEQKIDLYRYQLQEIGEARLCDGEEEELEHEKKRLASMERLLSHTHAIGHSFLGEGAGLDQLRSALYHLGELAQLDESLRSLHENGEQCFFQLEDVARECHSYGDTLNHDPTRLAEVEDRLQIIKHLKRKYGDSIQEILCYEQDITLQLTQLQQKDERENELSSRLDVLMSTLENHADDLADLRREVAQQLEEQMHKELSELHMKSTVFRVVFHRTHFSQMGNEAVEFLIAPNPGEPLRPLIKTASGGELSRIMLALKCIFCQQNRFHTLVFDEIDTGVSGRTAQAIAEKMTRVSKHHQVLCVTHLPQVACMADVHLFIQKKTKEERTHTNVHQLNSSNQLTELARMLSGVEVTKKTYQHAEEMVSLANQVKERI